MLHRVVRPHCSDRENEDSAFPLNPTCLPGVLEAAVREQQRLAAEHKTLLVEAVGSGEALLKEKQRLEAALKAAADEEKARVRELEALEADLKQVRKVVGLGSALP